MPAAVGLLPDVDQLTVSTPLVLSAQADRTVTMTVRSVSPLAPEERAGTSHVELKSELGREHTARAVETPPSEYVAAPLRNVAEETDAAPAANASYAGMTAENISALSGLSWAELMARDGETPRPEDREVVNPVEIFLTGDDVLASNRVTVPTGVLDYYPVLAQAIERAARDNGLVVCVDPKISANTANRQMWSVDPVERKDAVARLDSKLRNASIEVSAFVSALVRLPPRDLELGGRVSAGYCVAAWVAASHWWDVAEKVPSSRQTWWRELAVARKTLRESLELCVGGIKSAQSLMGAVCRLIRANVQNIVLGNRVREAATADSQYKLREWATRATCRLMRSGPGQYVATLPKFTIRKARKEPAKAKASVPPATEVVEHRPIHPGVSSRGGLATDREAAITAVINGAVSRLPPRVPNWNPKGSDPPDLWAWRIRTSLDRVYALLGPINRLFNRRRAELRAEIFSARGAQTGPNTGRPGSAPQRQEIGAEEWRLARERYRARDSFAAEEHQFFLAANHLAPEAHSFQELHLCLADPEKLFKAIWAQTFEKVWGLQPAPAPEIGPDAEILTAPQSEEGSSDATSD